MKKAYTNKHPECETDELFVGNFMNIMEKTHLPKVLISYSTFRFGEIAYIEGTTKVFVGYKPGFVKTSEYMKIQEGKE